MRYITEHTSSLLDVKSVAEVSNCSPYHFHRLFSSYVGEPLAEYIKKTRMKKAAALVYSGYPISAVAEETGYYTISSFGKVFRQTFGLSPTQFKYTEEAELSKFFHTPPNGGNNNLIFRPRLVEEPAHQVFLMRKRFFQGGIITENIGKAFDASFGEWDHILCTFPDQPLPWRKVGFIRNFNAVDPQHWFVDAGFIFKTAVDFGGFGNRIETTRIEKGRWAVFLHRGPYDTLWQTWSWIYNYWLWVSGHKRRDAPAYEVYLNEKKNTAPADLLTEIYVPVH